MSQTPDVSSLRLNNDQESFSALANTSRPTSSSHPKTPSNPKSSRPPTLSSEEAEARDVALRAELESVRRVNTVITGALESLEKAKGNMDTVTRTVNAATTLLDTWTRILSRTEHTQRLLLHPAWQGATTDLAEAEAETATKARAAQLREQEEERRREAAEERRRAEEERRRVEAATPRGRGAGRGQKRGVGSGVGHERTSSAVAGQVGGGVGASSGAGAQRGGAAARRAAMAGYGRVRGRGATTGTKRGGG